MKKVEKDQIHIEDAVIKSVAGIAVTECYGVVGMVSTEQVKDGINELLGKKHVGKGIKLKKTETGYEITTHIVVLYGVKISEVGKSIQEKVFHDLSTMLGITVEGVHVIVESVKVKES